MLRPSASGRDFDRVDNTSHPHDILKLYHTDRVINIKNKNIIDNIFFYSLIWGIRNPIVLERMLKMTATGYIIKQDT